MNLNANSDVRRGVLRISFIDSNTIEDINKFIKVFISGIAQQFTHDKTIYQSLIKKV